jgi:nucleolar pre-ribosomal-associated protein 1
MAYASVNITAVRDAIGSLIQHIFSGSILFEHDPEEVHFWLSSLPIYARPLDAESPGHTPFLNEQAAVVKFLDDCIQLCLKTPYGYIEELCTSSSETTTANGYQLGGNALSPLLATVMEQIPSRIAAGLGPSDTLSIVSFVRRLLVRLPGKMESLGLLICFSERLASLPISEIAEENHINVAKAVSQEITILKNHLALLGDPAAPVLGLESPSFAVADFLDRIEGTSFRTVLCFLRISSINERHQRWRAHSVRVWPLNSMTVCASMVLQATKRWQHG